MKIGVMADSHDNEQLLVKGIEIFKANHITTVFHLGDLCKADLLLHFSDFDFYLVQGNNDPSLTELNQALIFYGLRECKVFYELELEQKKICLMHGDNVNLFRKKMQENFDYLLKGHTHFDEDYRKGKTRVLNPGALERCTRYTVAILDLQTDEWTLHQVH